MKPEEAEEKAPVFSFGGPCPPIRPIFFPNDPEQQPRQLEEKDEQVDSAQPS